MSGMGLLLGSSIYLGAHFLVYVAALRKQPAFASEKVIFLYHVLSVLALACALGVILAAAPQASGVAVLAAALALHAIYSLSFLELWSLAQGGYSLTILEALETLQGRGAVPDATALQQVGTRKKQGRLQGLERLRLVRPRDEYLELTPRGSVVATILALIAWTAELKEVG